MKFKIGNVEMANQVCVAPMAGISNSAFRIICKEMGASLIYTEMVSDKAIVYKNKKTLDLLYMTDFERPLSQQIFGNDEKSFVEAARTIYKKVKPDIIDINMGCPVPKIALRSQAGSALLKDPIKVGQIVKAVVEAVPVPVTVKIRSGWDSDNINAVEIAKVCEKAGASAIAVHPRTRSQGYSGQADWNIIKEVKQSIKIPVIGNGDIKTYQDAKKMLDETGCDAVMIGRGVLGNPFLIKQTVEYLENGKVNTFPTREEKIDMCLKHLNLLIEQKGESVALREMRTFFGYYLKNENNVAKIRQQLMKETSLEKIIEILNSFKNGENNI